MIVTVNGKKFRSEDILSKCTPVSPFVSASTAWGDLTVTREDSTTVVLGWFDFVQGKLFLSRGILPKFDGNGYVIDLETNNMDAEIVRLCDEGRRIQAIKFVREQIAMGLKEAKDYVDRVSPPRGF